MKPIEPINDKIRAVISYVQFILTYRVHSKWLFVDLSFDMVTSMATPELNEFGQQQKTHNL